MLDTGIFSFCITETGLSIPELPTHTSFGKYTVLTDGRTPLSAAMCDDRACALFGLAVNVIDGTHQQLAQIIASTCKRVEDVIAYEKQLGGKYVLLFRAGDDYYIQGDATCSIPIFYNTDGDFMCTSNERYIIAHHGYPRDPAFDLIRKSGDISQAMPYDITPYRAVKQLIPNHYLHIGTRTAARFVNAAARQAAVSVEAATAQVMPMIETLVSYYQAQFPIYCPITSGRDSRVVLAFLKNGREDVPCYTIKHPEHRDNTPDVVIPGELCRTAGLSYELIEDVALSDELVLDMDALFGAGCYSARTLRIAETIRRRYGDGAIINGDIIGQVGKCSLHRDIPAWLATPGYFRCKLHNYSRGAKQQLKRWLHDIKAGGERVNTFDLFSIENRVGRWAGQENAIYNALGQRYLNVFNSRSILYVWTAVPRKKRKHSLLHVDLIRRQCPVLLTVPFEAEESFLFKISKATGLLYWLSSYAKFYIERAKFKKGRSR